MTSKVCPDKSMAGSSAIGWTCGPVAAAFRTSVDKPLWLFARWAASGRYMDDGAGCIPGVAFRMKPLRGVDDIETEAGNFGVKRP